MATPGGRTNSSVIGLLQRNPQRFSFFQAIRLLQLYYRQAAEGGATRFPLGYDYAPEAEVARLHAQPSLSFPASEIGDFDFEPTPAEDQPEQPSPLTVTFMGLFGPAGVLPTHYTQTVIDEHKAHKAAPSATSLTCSIIESSRCSIERGKSTACPSCLKRSTLAAKPNQRCDRTRYPNAFSPWWGCRR